MLAVPRTDDRSLSALEQTAEHSNACKRTTEAASGRVGRCLGFALGRLGLRARSDPVWTLSKRHLRGGVRPLVLAPVGVHRGRRDDVATVSLHIESRREHTTRCAAFRYDEVEVTPPAPRRDGGRLG